MMTAALGHMRIERLSVDWSACTRQNDRPTLDLKRDSSFLTLRTFARWAKASALETRTKHPSAKPEAPEIHVEVRGAYRPTCYDLALGRVGRPEQARTDRSSTLSLQDNGP